MLYQTGLAVCPLTQLQHLIIQSLLNGQTFYVLMSTTLCIDCKLTTTRTVVFIFCLCCCLLFLDCCLLILCCWLCIVNVVNESRDHHNREHLKCARGVIHITTLISTQVLSADMDIRNNDVELQLSYSNAMLKYWPISCCHFTYSSSTFREVL